jgi:hypothetical protein
VSGLSPAASGPVLRAGQRDADGVGHGGGQLLLASPQIVRVVNDSLDPDDLKHAEQQVTNLFGSTEWRPILDGRQSGALDAERTRNELTNLMRWRLEKTLGYGFTHTALTKSQGAGDRFQRALHTRGAGPGRAAAHQLDASPECQLTMEATTSQVR